MKYFLYARKSTDEDDRQVLSIESQITELREFGEKEKLEIVDEYIESKTAKTQYRTLKGEDFLFLILQHVLPKGFRRVRDYGFLHSNAKRLLVVVQLVLQVFLTVIKARPRSVFKCPCCQTPMVILGFRYPALESG